MPVGSFLYRCAIDRSSRQRILVDLDKVQPWQIGAIDAGHGNLLHLFGAIVRFGSIAYARDPEHPCMPSTMDVHGEWTYIGTRTQVYS